MTWVAVAAVVALVGGLALWYWRVRRRRRSRLISFVALVREPVSFDPTVLANVASKAWQADLGDGDSPGADGFVAGTDHHTVIMHQGRMLLVNNFPKPYVEDHRRAAEGITDLRIRGLFAEHRGWFSCDALGVNYATPEEEVQDWYRRLGLLMSALLDDNCLLLLIPDRGQACPINEDTEAALRASDPLAALQGSIDLPVVEVSSDDPLMQQAVREARRRWPEFVAAFDERAGENFSVKAPVTYGDNTEFIWIEVTALEGDRIYGRLGNDPVDLGPLKFGSNVSVPLEDLNDWCYIDRRRNLVGAFTVAAVQEAARRRKQP